MICLYRWAPVVLFTVVFACAAQDAVVGTEPPVVPPAARRLADTFTVTARIGGLVGRAHSMSPPLTYLGLYAYFEGDSVARSVGVTGAGAKGEYTASVSDQLIVPSDPSRVEVPRRRWRVLIVATPINANITLAIGEWTVRSAGDTSSIDVRLDVPSLARGELPPRLPIAIPTGLPTRTENADTSKVTDSLRQFGGDVFVRVNAARPPVLDVLAHSAAIVSIADAGLQHAADHGAFMAPGDSRYPNTPTFSVWGRFGSNASRVLERLAALPFVVDVVPLNFREGDEPITSYPTLDSKPVSAVDGRRFIYVNSSRCYYVIAGTDEVSGVGCGELVLGLKAGVASWQLFGDLNRLGARLTSESPTWQVPDGFRSMWITVPAGAERRALNWFQQHPLLRYVGLNMIGGGPI